MEDFLEDASSKQWLTLALVEYLQFIGVSCCGEIQKLRTRSLLALGYNPEDPVFLNPDFAKNNVDFEGSRPF